MNKHLTAKQFDYNCQRKEWDTTYRSQHGTVVQLYKSDSKVESSGGTSHSLHVSLLPGAPISRPDCLWSLLNCWEKKKQQSHTKKPPGENST
jgi:hypothetical protein